MSLRQSSVPRAVTRLALGALAVGFACASYSWLLLPDVRPLAAQPPERTAFMDLRQREAQEAGKPAREVRRWLAYNRISPNLKRAVLAAEDAGFWDHDGVDYYELRASIRTSIQQRTAPRGASTITQQLAKNLYLSPSRNPWRKAVELMITRRLEAELPKVRLFELYLNIVEWGDGIWGADAAARAYFGRSAAELTPPQAALLAGALINPRLYSPARPNARLRARRDIILRRMGIGTDPAPSRPSVDDAAPTDDAVPADDAVPVDDAVPADETPPEAGP